MRLPPLALLPALLPALLLLLLRPTSATIHDGRPALRPVPLVVTIAANASAAECFAAEELARYLRTITNGSSSTAVLLVNATSAAAAAPQLAVGYGAARLLGVPAGQLQGLGREGYVLSPALRGASLALSGGLGAPRGTLYAVNEFLEAIGVQFLAADVTVLPKRLPPQLPVLPPRYVPRLEYRQTYGFQLIGAPDFNTHLRLNKGHFNDPVPELDAAHGGVYPVYAAPPGDAHTSYALLPGGLNRGLEGPPPELFKSHRGWFWPQEDNASGVYGQLCWSNRSLQDFLVKRVKGFLRSQPGEKTVFLSDS
jgi:hypothetical protein